MGDSPSSVSHCSSWPAVEALRRAGYRVVPGRNGPDSGRARILESDDSRNSRWLRKKISGPFRCRHPDLPGVPGV